MRYFIYDICYSCYLFIVRLVGCAGDDNIRSYLTHCVEKIPGNHSASSISTV